MGITQPLVRSSLPSHPGVTEKHAKSMDATTSAMERLSFPIIHHQPAVLIGAVSHPPSPRPFHLLRFLVENSQLRLTQSNRICASALLVAALGTTSQRWLCIAASDHTTIAMAGRASDSDSISGHVHLRQARHSPAGQPILATWWWAGLVSQGERPLPGPTPKEQCPHRASPAGPRCSPRWRQGLSQRPAAR
jgi:hypothetical protein